MSTAGRGAARLLLVGLVLCVALARACLGVKDRSRRGGGPMHCVCVGRVFSLFVLFVFLLFFFFVAWQGFATVLCLRDCLIDEKQNNRAAASSFVRMSATQLVVVCVLIVCLVGHLGIAGAYGVSCEGNCVNGHGVLTWPDGQRYEGEFKDGNSNGHGVYTWPDGQRYEGEFKDGLPISRSTSTS